MSLRFSVLASGSTGNAIYVETNHQRLLIDAGLSGKKMEQCLREIGVSPSQLDGILVSHEHSDHIKGVGILARRFKLPIYANEKTWQAMERGIGEIPLEQKFHIQLGTTQSFADLNVETFGVSHDAVDPMFFSFHHEGKKLTVLTDTGYVSDHLIGVAKESNSLIFEANHDTDMLRMGKYPWNIKRRILGDEGHVSNVDAGIALASIISDSKVNVYLAHLSRENNMKELARMTVQQTLEKYEVEVGRQVKIYDTDPSTPTPLKVV